ncbi:MAG TPA: hypothetical protein PKW80_03855 [Bacteroidales bacterium]|nr:hypothetical protein [Bacteroidales bacterium]
MKKILLIFIVIAALVSSCKKERTFNRLLGRHILTEYTVNGIDSLQSYKDSLGTEFYFFYDDLYERYKAHILGYSDVYDDHLIIWHWSFHNNYNNLVVFETYSFTSGIGPIGGNKTPDWEIIKIKNDIVKLKTNYNNKEYVLCLINK